MPSPNWTNRTMWTVDNLDIMRGLTSESVDLICLDPRFNSIRPQQHLIAAVRRGAK